MRGQPYVGDASRGPTGQRREEFAVRLVVPALSRTCRVRCAGLPPSLRSCWWRSPWFRGAWRVRVRGVTWAECPHGARHCDLGRSTDLAPFGSGPEGTGCVGSLTESCHVPFGGNGSSLAAGPGRKSPTERRCPRWAGAKRHESSHGRPGLGTRVRSFRSLVTMRSPRRTAPTTTAASTTPAVREAPSVRPTTRATFSSNASTMQPASSRERLPAGRHPAKPVRTPHLER